MREGRWTGVRTVRVGSQSRAPADFLERYVLSRFLQGFIKPRSRLGVDEFLVAQLFEERESHWDSSIRKGVHEP